MDQFCVKTLNRLDTSVRYLLFLLFLGLAVQTVQAQTPPDNKLIVNDVTQLNPIVVGRIVKPRTVDEIIDAVKNAKGPVSIGGGRFSMGGQTATENAVQLDMREFNKVLSFSQEQKEITVQTGATWRQIQQYIDPYNLSIKIMQTYSNFTVGGSLSVNVHGRYIGMGPLILSVKQIGIVLAEGTYLHVSPTYRPELFYGAIGGYGGIGVVTDATLSLDDNVKVRRVTEVMPLSRYKDYFVREVRNNPKVIFHNADIYPNAYDTVRVTSYENTDRPLTVQDRLIPADQSYWLDRMMFGVISEAPGGKAFRQHVLDPILFSGERVTWRNYEASYTVMELEPTSRKDSTYVLQEYFVPVENIDDFVPKMAKVLNNNKVNVVNVSIRHARKDPGSYLAWAKQEVFAFVLYYKQGTMPEDREHVGVWTRQLVDAAISSGGRYYLPYQIHATQAQFKAAYPGWEKLFELKKAVDPTNKFRNKLWDAYYPETEPVATNDVPNSVRDFVATLKDYRQDEGQTFLTMPEWFLVYSPDEYANYIDKHSPSAYPYFGSIGQFWGYYGDAIRASSQYPFNAGYHVMVSVIGASFTAENLIKGIYENTIGRLSEFTISGDEKTDEDKYAIEMAKDYVKFIRVYPWYEYNFLGRLKGIWSEPPATGSNMIRKYERKIALSAEYAIKTVYGGLIKFATKSAYGDAEKQVYAIVRNVPDSEVLARSGIKIMRRFEHGYAVVSLPRYEKFMQACSDLFASGAAYVEIAGNSKILATVLANREWHPDSTAGKELYEKAILTNDKTKRVGLEIDVRNLHQAMSNFQGNHVTLEHLYDY